MSLSLIFDHLFGVYLTICFLQHYVYAVIKLDWEPLHLLK